MHTLMNEKRSLVPLGRNSPRLQIEEVRISLLKRNTRSPRVHPEKQIIMLARNIDTFGFLLPCLIDNKNRLLCGNARVEAAERLGMKTIPVIRIGHLNEAEQRVFILGDAKLAEYGTWNQEVLREEIQFFIDLNIDFDFSIIGFETAEVDIILEGAENQADDNPTDISPQQQPISRLGEVWQAGHHRIYCGDALSAQSYEAVLNGNLAGLVITDPPFNVRITGHVGGSGEVQHREFAMASGEMAPDQFASFLTGSMKHLAAHSRDGSLHYVFMDWRHCQEILSAGNVIYSELKNICVWCKTNAGMGSFYRSQHELVFVFKNGRAPHINNINLGVHGRNRSNVWDYAGINGFGRHRDELLAMHPTVKPLALVADVIKDASARGDFVLDAFGGSGSTLLAAEKTGRRAALIEIDPLYVDVAIRRWQATTGGEAFCASSGETFAEREAAIDADVGSIATAERKGPRS
jgi:DNA modification methylase